MPFYEQLQQLFGGRPAMTNLPGIGLYMDGAIDDVRAEEREEVTGNLN